MSDDLGRMDDIDLEEIKKIIDSDPLIPAPVTYRPQSVITDMQSVQEPPAFTTLPAQPVYQALPGKVEPPPAEEVDRFGVPLSLQRYDPVHPLQRSNPPAGQKMIPYQPRQTPAVRLPPPTIRSRPETIDLRVPVEQNPEPDIGPEDFDIDFDFDGEYADVPEERPLNFRREKRTGIVGGILYSVVVICVSIVLASLLWMATVDVLGFASNDELVNVVVPPGFTMEGITDMLYDAGLIRYRFLFSLYAEFSNAEEKITEGTYMLNKNYDYRAIVQGMTARAGIRVETTVTIPEGLTMAQIFNLLEDYGVCPAGDLWEAATNHDFNFSFLDKATLGDRLRLEGFLFPDTYNFYLDSTPVQAILRMLREFSRRFPDDMAEHAAMMGYSVREIITLASMIEREAGDDEERPRIAAVIYNRLNSRDFPYLEIDATIFYAIARTNIPFSIELDHPYNTYMYEGLPPGPIASPGMASIRAALYPDSTNEYFYALNKHGTHNFFRTYAQHQAFVRSDEYGGRR